MCIRDRVDKIAQELEQNIDEEQTAAPKEKVYYSSVAYLQPVSYTHLDVYKRQSHPKPSLGRFTRNQSGTYPKRII